MDFSRNQPRMTALDFEQLSILRGMAEAGSELAPAAALHYCAQYNVPAPHWLVQLASGAYCTQLNPATPKKRGRSAGAIERYHQDMVDLIRWDQTRQCRYNQKKSQSNVVLLRTHFQDLPLPIKESYLKMAAWTGRDWLRAYECVSMMLRETPAFGGPDAIKASYCRVEQNHRHPTKKWRYFLFDPEFLISVGLTHPSRWDQSSKWVPLYDLTL